MKFWSNSDIPAASGFVPEKRLLAAVLQRAITDFISGEGDVKEGARSWLMDDDDNENNDSPLTFKFICEALDMEINHLRRAIQVQALNAPEGVLQEALV